MDFCIRHRGEPKDGRWVQNDASKFSCSISSCADLRPAVSPWHHDGILLCVHTVTPVHSYTSTPASLRRSSTFNTGAVIESLKEYKWESGNDVMCSKCETNEYAATQPISCIFTVSKSLISLRSWEKNAMFLNVLVFSSIKTAVFILLHKNLV